MFIAIYQAGFGHDNAGIFGKGPTLNDAFKNFKRYGGDDSIDESEVVFYEAGMPLDVEYQPVQLVGGNQK
jgi:hypothetical protein